MNRAMGEEQFGGSELEQRTRTLLVESTEALSGAVRSQLTQARHAALEARPHGARYRLQRWLPAGALAAAALAVLVIYLPHKHPAPTVAVISGSIDDIDLLTSDVPLNGDPDVDYSFYEWAVDAAGGSAGAHVSSTAGGSNGT
jgi:hypothetical protein